MTKLFHTKTCPACRFNHENFACQNGEVALRQTEWEKQTYGSHGFTVFKGTTNKICHKGEVKQ